MPSRPRLLRAGDVVRFDGRLHTVAALEGTAVRLVDEAQSASVVMLAHLLSSSGFEAVTPASVRTVVPAAGVLEGLPAKAVERPEWWQRHLVEMLTGRPPNDPQGRVRSEYDPAVRSLRQRELARAAELAAAGHSTSLALIQRMRRRFENEGVLGLVDPRLRAASDGTGRADRRVVEALRKVVGDQTGRSTVSAQVLRRRMERLLEAEHGPEAVPLPSRTAFYRLLKAVSSGRHTLGSALLGPAVPSQPCPPGPASGPVTMAEALPGHRRHSLHPQRPVPRAPGPHDPRPLHRRSPPGPALHSGRSRSSLGLPPLRRRTHRMDSSRPCLGLRPRRGLSSPQPLDRPGRLRPRAAARPGSNPRCHPRSTTLLAAPTTLRPNRHRYLQGRHQQALERPGPPPLPAQPPRRTPPRPGPSQGTDS